MFSLSIAPISVPSQVEIFQSVCAIHKFISLRPLVLAILWLTFFCSATYIIFASDTIAFVSRPTVTIAHHGNGRLSSPRLLSFLADNDNGGERFNQATAEEGTVKEGWDCFTWAHETAELTHVLDRDVSVLSGGELQRFAIAAVALCLCLVWASRSVWSCHHAV